MVKPRSAHPAEAERELALSYAPMTDRPALAALFALDRRLGDVVRTTREPMVGQMRLTWWHESLGTLDPGHPPAEPVLRELARTVLSPDIGGGELAALVDGWESLLDARPVDDAALASFAQGRGGRLFVLAGRVLGAGDLRLAVIGEGWALADLAANLSDADAAARAAALARSRLAALGERRWPRALRSLAALALLARSDLTGGAAGRPRRVVQLALMRLTGR